MADNPIIRKMSPDDWHQLIRLAKARNGYQFDSTLDHYLVLTVEQYLTDCDIFDKTIALEYLQALQLSGQQGFDSLRKTGDHCLLLSGFFPQRAQRHNVTLEYYINMGRNAYASIADRNSPEHINSELFYDLSEHFMGLSDILHHIKANASPI